MSLLAELQRRNVIRMAGLYLVGAWLIVQVASTVFPAFGLPDWALRGVILLLAIGFPAALVFSWVFELTPGGVKRDGEVPEADSAAPQTAQRMNRMIIVVLVLALGYFAVDKFVLTPARDGSSDPVAKATLETAASSDIGAEALDTPAAPAIDTKSIAVLAFANMSADKDNEYFSDGVAEEILNALAKIDDLKVAGRTSSFYFKGRNESLATIGSTLGVAHVLEGSVRKQGDRLRISAKLLRVSDGVEVWADIFEGTDADVFALQENIAQQVTSQLKVALNAGQQDRLIDIGTSDPEAYALYLRATDIFNRRDVARYEEAIAALQQALQRDPKFARAHSRLATLYIVSPGRRSNNQDASLEAKARQYAEQALQLNPALAESHAVLGQLLQAERRFGESRAAFDRALQLDASDVTTNLWSALSYCITGYTARCRSGLERTLAIDPLLPNALNWRARIAVSDGEIEIAGRLMERARGAGLQTGEMVRFWIARKRGDAAEIRNQALEVVRLLQARLPPDAAGWIAEGLAGNADARVRALEAIDEYLVDPPEPISDLVPWALVVLGEVDRGLATFTEFTGSFDGAFLGDFLGARMVPEVWTSPLFPEFLRKTGIAAYWDEFGPPEHCRKLDNGDYRCE